MARVLIVDDSPTARQLIAEILQSDPEIEIVGNACDGVEAVELTQKLQPDIITMDIHMPQLNGLEATQQIMTTCPTPIVMLSASTVIHDVEWAMKAIQAGALTLLMKPPGPQADNYESAIKELVGTVKAMAGVKVVRRRSHRAEVSNDAPVPKLNVERGPHVIAIAASTGGPPAIKQILSELPADFPAPILIVQHIACGFTKGFVSWLDLDVQLTVKIAEQNEKLSVGTVYIAPEGLHLGSTPGGNIKLSRAKSGGICPSADFLFESVGQSHASTAIAVILTGMGSDGVKGLEVIRANDGYVIAQDEESSVVYGMPKAAKDAGVVDVTIPLEHIGRAISRALVRPCKKSLG